jgi:small subunit ribosomal protein S17
MQKTVLVAVEANFRHRLYKKTVRRVRRLMAHDEGEDARMGDRVRIVEASPISRRKRWRVVQVLTRAQLPDVAPESIDLELLGEVKREEIVEAVVAPAANGASEVAAPVVEVEALPEAAIADEVEIEIEEAVQAQTEAEAPADEEPATDEEAIPDEEVGEDVSEPEVLEEAEIEALETDVAPEDSEPASDTAADETTVEDEPAGATDGGREEESA